MENKNEIDIYLRPTRIIDSDNALIRENAASIINGADSDAERASKIFYFVRDKIRYNPYSPFHEEGHYIASVVLNRGYGYCIQKAVVLAALGRAADIPTRLGFADIRNHQLPKKMLELQGTDIIFSHGFTEFFIDGRWIKATPAFNIEMTERLGLVAVEFDGRSDATFPRLDKKGKISIEYIKDVGSWPDLPFDHIMDAFLRLFGEERFSALIEMIKTHGFDGAMGKLGVGDEAKQEYKK